MIRLFITRARSKLTWTRQSLDSLPPRIHTLILLNSFVRACQRGSVRSSSGLRARPLQQILIEVVSIVVYGQHFLLSYMIEFASRHIKESTKTQKREIAEADVRRAYTERAMIESNSIDCLALVCNDFTYRIEFRQLISDSTVSKNVYEEFSAFNRLFLDAEFRLRRVLELWLGWPVSLVQHIYVGQRCIVDAHQFIISHNF